MTYDVSITNMGRYLHVKTSGVECLRNFTEIWAAVARECEKQAVKRVLCEGCLEGTGLVLDIDTYIRHMSEAGMPQGTRIAIVCSEEDYEQFGFAERPMTTNSPVFPRIFPNLDDALAWITK